MPDCEVAAMLDCEDGEKVNSNCQHCEAASGEAQQPRSYWNISLDLDLLQTIVNFYPEWFKDCNMNAVAEGSPDNSMCIPLASCDLKNGDVLHRLLDKSREALKTPPAFHDQRQKFVKARIGSILKHKLPKRFDRQDIIQQVFESDSNYLEKEKQPKKSPLEIQTHHSQNPATLELVKENIFTDELLAKAVEESALAFKSPCNTPSPKMRIDDDSDGIFSSSPPYEFNEHSQGSLPSLEASEPSPMPNQGSPCSGVTSFSMSPPSSVSSPLSVLPAVVSPPQSEQIAEYIVHLQQQQLCAKETTPNKNRKKTKPKTQPKARTIKFHEYRGPPNSKNGSSSTSALAESPPELNFQQRQLFLELQNAFHQHNTRPQVIVSSPINVAQKNSGDQAAQIIQKQVSSNQQSEQQNSSQKLISNFEDLKVSDLRAELKKRKLPVSGSKPQLIERLKSHHSASANSMVTGSGMDQAELSIDSIVLENLTTIPTPGGSAEATVDSVKEFLSTLPSDSLSSALISLEGDPCNGFEFGELGTPPFTSLSNEEIVQLQQICIERLQRDLEKSQRKLQECQQPLISPVADVKPSVAAVPVKSAAGNFKNGDTSTSTESKIAQKQIIQQLLQQKIQRQEQEQQKIQKQQTDVTSLKNAPSTKNSTLTALLRSGPLNANLVDIDLNCVAKTFFSTSEQTIKREKELNTPDEYSRATDSHCGDDFPGVIPIFRCESSTQELTSNPPVISTPNLLSNRSSSLPSFSALCKPPPTRSNTDPQFQITRPPPDYDAATRHLNKVKQHDAVAEDGNPRQPKKHKTSVKSQAVDDVLAVLIASGDLPPSAAEEPPLTPISNNGDPVSLFQTSTTTSDVFFSKASFLSNPVVTTQMDGLPHSPDISLAQSVMDMTPPSSAGFGETVCTTNTSLDFSPLLDLNDMDLGLDDDNEVSSSLDPTLSISLSQDLKASLDYGVHKSNSLINCSLRTGAGTDRGVDSDIIEWLPVNGEIQSSISNHFHNSSSSYSLTNEPDSLFSNGQDTLDFLGDEMDFNTPSDLFFPWGEKPDFT